MAGIVVFGITGRMGQSLIRALREKNPDAHAAATGTAATGGRTGRHRTGGGPLNLSGAVASTGSARLGQDAAADGAPLGVTITADAAAALTGAAVAVDFSGAKGVADNARACAQAGVPLLVGTTGFDAVARAALAEAAKRIPVLIAPNTSVGVSVVAKLVELATVALGTDYDVEISEAHHRMKRDAPSGTALALGETVAGARGRQLSDVAVFDRHSDSAPRGDGDIGFSVLRAGDIVGEHTVTFAVAGERVEITHRATDRITFARGALRAAEWLIGRPAGLYKMADVLGLSSAPDSPV
jgi:4-hydroxy-tetrahydrodipicolinate reductase